VFYFERKRPSKIFMCSAVFSEGNGLSPARLHLRNHGIQSIKAAAGATSLKILFMLVPPMKCIRA
ncbi:MAG TPA: hypothetical protein DCG57_15260, partial [Candidatus Riflebacteria bacterium]|nr:hypothetical protein [Candidatus Riflebacteria bacterium]